MELRRCGSRAFTLVELLVVVGIVSVLASIVLSVAIAAKSRAKQTSCLSNLRQAGLALGLYASDYDDFLPPYPNYEYHIQTWDPVGWPTVPTKSDLPDRLAACLLPYRGSAAVWFCPEDKHAGKDDFMGGIRHKHFSYWYRPLDPDTLTSDRLLLHVCLSSSTILGKMLMHDAASPFGSDNWEDTGYEFSNHPDRSVTVLRSDLSIVRYTGAQWFLDSGK